MTAGARHRLQFEALMRSQNRNYIKMSLATPAAVQQVVLLKITRKCCRCADDCLITNGQSSAVVELFVLVEANKFKNTQINHVFL